MKKPATAKAYLGRFFRMVLPAVLILIAGAVAALGVLVYRISNPGAVPDAVNPSHYLLPSLEVEVPTKDPVGLYGWWIPGLKGAPAVILAPGYGMSRSDALSLAAALHESGFNLLVYGQRGSAESPKRASTLGLYETEDMVQAVRLVRSRPESDRSRIGIWGVDVGALAALRAAANFAEIRAIVADCAFEKVSDFLDYRIAEEFELDNRVVQLGCLQIFRLAHLFGGSLSEEEIPLRELSDRTILFITGENRRRLGDLTSAFYDKIRPRKEMISFKTARVHAMSGEDLRSYDRQVANFFTLNLR